MYKHYLEAIVRHYEKRKSNCDLPQSLLHPKRSKIRNECVFVFKSRFMNKDLGMLRNFFEVHSDVDLLITIKKFDIDKFRPLVNYLMRQTIATDNKNIELLGWLLDYPHRPFNDRYNYEVDEMLSTEDETKDIKKSISEIEGNQMLLICREDNENGNQSNPNGNRRQNNTNTGFEVKRWRIIAVILIFLGIGGAVFFSNSSGENKYDAISPGQKGCMVWNDDHYEQISCDSFSRGRDVWPIKKDRLNNFRRITRPDTISQKDIGNIWYIKRSKDSLDFFTDGGKDPVNPTRYLNPLSRYMYEKYLLNKYH